MFDNFNHQSGLTHFVTTTKGGESTGAYSSFNLATHTGDNLKHVSANRSKLCADLNIKSEQLIIPEQTHSANVGVVALGNEELSCTDALITDKPNLAIAVLTADCVPVLLYDKSKKVIGVVHAGWRGLRDNIIPKTIGEMTSNFQCNPKDMIAAVGPCISTKNYEVGEEVAEEFKQQLKFSKSTISMQYGPKPHLDLKTIAASQLLVSGVLNIEVSLICTYEDTNYYSARRQGIESGRFASGLMMG